MRLPTRRVLKPGFLLVFDQTLLCEDRGGNKCFWLLLVDIVAMEHKETSHRQDVACSRCRERKTRCSKEKPVCGTCRAENSECDYSLPEKRVNHTKLL